MSSEAASGLGQSESSNQQSQSGWKSFALRFFHEFQHDDLLGTAAEVAYHLLFAIPPLIILTVMVTALLNRYTGIPVVENFHTLVNKHAPGDLQPVLNSVINTAVAKVGGGAASLGVAVTGIIALWSGSNSVSSLIKGFNRMHDVDEGRPYVKKRLIALGLTVALILFIIIAFALFVFGREIGSAIAGHVGLGPTFNTSWNILRWPVAVVLVMVLLGLLYYVGPSAEQSWKTVALGAVVATILWIVAVFGFKLYLAVSNPGSAYGAFGGLIVFLFFLYMTSIVFLVGVELNTVLEEMRRHDIAGAPVTGRSIMGGGRAHDVVAAGTSATTEARAEELTNPGPRKMSSPRGPGSKEPTP